MAEEKPKASEVISMLEKMGGVSAAPGKAPTDVSSSTSAFLDAMRGKITDALTIPTEMMGHETPAFVDPLVAIHSKLLPSEIACSLAEVMAGLEGDSYTFGELIALGMLIPDGFASIQEVMLHPEFIEFSKANHGCLWAVTGFDVQRFDIDHPFPKADVVDVDHVVTGVDPHYYHKPDWYDDLSELIERGEPVLIIGPAGSGKSQAVEQVFADREQTLEIVSCTPRTTANDLEGATDLVVHEGHQITRFTPAAPAVACEAGHGLLLDEADAAPSEAMYSMYRILDGKPMHIVRKGYDGKIPIHPEFRMIGTQNTEGRGDDRGLYHGRAYQDEAFLDRWRYTIRVDYPKAEIEILILRKRTGISGPEGEDIVKSAEALRNALEKDEIMLTCTLRRTLAVASSLAAGMSPQKAWDLSVVNRATPEDGQKIRTILQRIYGSKLKKAKKRKKVKT